MVALFPFASFIVLVPLTVLLSRLDAMGIQPYLGQAAEITTLIVLVSISVRHHRVSGRVAWLIVAASSVVGILAVTFAVVAVSAVQPDSLLIVWALSAIAAGLAWRRPVVPREGRGDHDDQGSRPPPGPSSSAFASQATLPGSTEPRHGKRMAPRA